MVCWDVTCFVPSLTVVMVASELLKRRSNWAPVIGFVGAPGVMWVDDGRMVMMEFDGSSCGVFESLSIQMVNFSKRMEKKV